MDPLVCNFFASVSTTSAAFQCYDFVNVCQESFFLDPTVSPVINSLGFTVSFCDTKFPNVAAPCASVASFGTVVQSLTSALNVTELSSQYSLTRVPDCLALAMAVPSIPKIQQVYQNPPPRPTPSSKTQLVWIDYLVMAGILLGVILVIVGLVKKSKSFGTIGFVVLAGTSLYGVDRWA